MRRTEAIVLGVLVASACGAPQAREEGGAVRAAALPAAFAAPVSAPAQAATVSEADLRAAAETITPEAAYERVSFLASDALRGRDTPSRGLDSAAAYIASQFRSFGVEPGGEDGTYFQRWPYPVIGLAGEDAVLALRTGSGTRSLRYGTEFAAEPVSAGRFEGRLVFTGAARQLEALPAARGQVAAVFLPGTAGGEWASARSRARAAAEEAGARAIVFILDPGFTASHVTALSRDLSATRRIVGDVAGIPTVFAAFDAMKPVFQEAGVDLDALRQRASAGPIAAVPLENVTATVASPVRIVEDARPPNVVGVIRGSDPRLRDTYVVLSAHMDHLGARENGGQLVVFNGADDNASGTTGVMMVARALASLDSPPARSVVFLLVSGEEKGLLGSRWFSDHPTVPVERIVANLNMDMIGRNNPDSIAVLGQEYSSLGPLVHRVSQAHPELRMTVAPDLWPQERLFFRSDQFNFARKEIPNLFFFAGLHEDYHQPSDTAEKINTDKLSRVARLVFYATHEIANEPNPPQWTPAGLAEVRAMVGGRE